MKKLVLLTLCLLFVLSTGALAADGNPGAGISETVEASVTVGPYAKIEAQKVVLQDCWWLFWKGGEPGMDFGYYTGEDGYGKAADSNCFILETNTDLTVSFHGRSLRHTVTGDAMLTRYWAWLSRGVDPLPEPWLFINVPEQIQPYEEIGYFGEAGKAPRKDNGRVFEQILDRVLKSFKTDFWPEDDWEEDKDAVSNHVRRNGLYAFQVFGFASTDEISSQPAGNYVGQIIVTVSK